MSKQNNQPQPTPSTKERGNSGNTTKVERPKPPKS